jgi:hypothetical protein
MTENIYKEYQNKYYNPNDNDKKPGDNDNWKSIQKGFHDISEKQLETSAGLTLGKGTEDETNVTARELKAMKRAEGQPIVVGGFDIAWPFQTINPYAAVSFEYTFNDLTKIIQWMKDSGAIQFYLIAPAVRTAVNANTAKLDYVPVFTLGESHSYYLNRSQIDTLTGFAINVINRTGETVSEGYSTGSSVYVAGVYSLEE